MEEDQKSVYDVYDPAYTHIYPLQESPVSQARSKVTLTLPTYERQQIEKDTEAFCREFVDTSGVATDSDYIRVYLKGESVRSYDKSHDMLSSAQSSDSLLSPPSDVFLKPLPVSDTLDIPTTNS